MGTWFVLSARARPLVVAASLAFRSDFGFAALACALLGVGLLTGFLSNKADPTRILGGLGFLVAAGMLAYVAVFRIQPLAQDLREGRVPSIEGAIGRERMAGSGAEPASHWLDVDGKRLACGLTAYEAAEQPGIVRLYDLARSRKVVNFERLPNRPLPAGAVNGSLVASTVRTALSLDRKTHDERASSGSPTSGRTCPADRIAAAIALLANPAAGTERGGT